MYSVQTFIYKNWMIEMTTQNMCCLVENSFIVWYWKLNALKQLLNETKSLRLNED